MTKIAYDFWVGDDFLFLYLGACYMGNIPL